MSMVTLGTASVSDNHPSTVLWIKSTINYAQVQIPKCLRQRERAIMEKKRLTETGQFWFIGKIIVGGRGTKFRNQFFKRSRDPNSPNWFWWSFRHLFCNRFKQRPISSNFSCHPRLILGFPNFFPDCLVVLRLETCDKIREIGRYARLPGSFFERSGNHMVQESDPVDIIAEILKQWSVKWIFDHQVPLVFRYGLVHGQNFGYTQETSPNLFVTRVLEIILKPRFKHAHGIQFATMEQQVSFLNQKKKKENGGGGGVGWGGEKKKTNNNKTNHALIPSPKVTGCMYPPGTLYVWRAGPTTPGAILLTDWRLSWPMMGRAPERWTIFPRAECAAGIMLSSVMLPVPYPALASAKDSTVLTPIRSPH